MKIKSWRSDKRTVRRTNVICDHIDKWNKRNLWNGTDETQWDVLTRVKADEVSGRVSLAEFPF